MKRVKHCQNCRKILFKSRNPHQHYCGDSHCQKIRKNQWRKAKRVFDVDYKDNQRQSNRRWRAKHKDYWKHYRDAHPDYVSTNREKQRIRDQFKGKVSFASHLANSDALSSKNSVKPGTYRLIPVVCGSLANSDAYTVKIDVITESYPLMTHLANRPPYGQTI